MFLTVLGKLGPTVRGPVVRGPFVRGPICQEPFLTMLLALHLALASLLLYIKLSLFNLINQHHFPHSLFISALCKFSFPLNLFIIIVQFNFSHLFFHLACQINSSHSLAVLILYFHFNFPHAVTIT